ncbi:MAG: WD40/YVTN/BNR-like repeat-containing protein [Ktedonobacterales bacterium]
MWCARGGRKAGFPQLALVALVVVVLVMAGCGPTGPYWETLDSSQSDTIMSLAQDTSQTKILYAGANHGAVYRTRTDGVSSPINGSGLPSSAVVNALLPDPHRPGIVYAATTSGLYVTTDDGNSWNPLGTGLPNNDVLTALAFGANGTLLAGTLAHGVYASADQGHTWTSASAGLPASASVNILFSDSTTQTVFAGLDGDGLYASADNGQTWTQRTSGLPANAHVYALAETPSKGINPSGPTLYVGAGTGLYASADDGRTWTQSNVRQGLPSGSVRALAADLQTPGVLYAGIGSTVYTTTDGGTHWSELASGLSHQVTSLVVAIPPGGKAVVFAGAGQLQRFPAIGASNNPIVGTIFTWGFILLLAGLGFYVIRRARLQREDSARRMRSRIPPPNRPQL